uniref:SH3 domain-containing protein n=3 Tax=Magallana gigas TaxID=29159 RepID=A0A8W8LDU3_MAGGI
MFSDYCESCTGICNVSSFGDNTDCIAITSLTGPGGSQWFDEDRLCVYLRFARHRVDTSKHSSCDFVLKTVIQNQTSDFIATTSSLPYSSTSLPPPTVLSSDILKSSPVTVDMSSFTQLVTKSSSFESISPVATTTLQDSSADTVWSSQELSPNVGQPSAPFSADPSSEVISFQLSSTPHLSSEYSVSSVVTPSSISSQSLVLGPLVPSLTSSSSSVSPSSIVSSLPTPQLSSDIVLTSTFTESSSALTSSSSTFVPIQSHPTSILKETISPSTTLPVLPTSSSVFPGVTTTQGETNNTVSSTPAPLLGTGLELVIALSIIGAGLLIFFIIIVCVCVRRKKPGKHEKYQPNPVTEDLWVSGRSEVPLNHIDLLPQVKVTSEVDRGSAKLRNGITHFNTATVRRSYSPALRHTVTFFDEVEEKYIAIYNFEGKNEDCLTLKEGDIVVVTHKDNNGWWKGSLNGKTGLCPGSYLKEVSPEVDFKKNNRLSNGSQPFEISLDVDTNGPRPVSSFMAPESGFTKKASSLQRESNKVSTLNKHALGKEVGIPHIPDDVGEDREKDDKAVKRRSTISPVKEDINIEGTQFKVLFSYTANFKEEVSLQEGEIVTGIRKDRNGWMYGRKNRTNEVGHFPAVYVEVATQEDIEAASFSQFGYPDKETVYKQLQVNKTSHHDEDLIGIEHRALHYYAAEDEQDLSFDKGDIILVYEVNENGWWRGKHGEEVGWFPGSYVELVDEDPTELKYKGPGELSVSTEDRVRSSSFLSVGSITNVSKTSDEETGSICSAGTTDSRRRPVRKAPPPPVGPKSPRTPTTKQPPRPPSHVPWANQTESTPIDKSANQSRDISLNGSARSVNESDSVDGGPNGSIKPEVPKRFIKPKLVKISKKKINLKQSFNSVRASKSPPPPRPNFPKHIPKSPLNRSKDGTNQYNKLNGTHNSGSEVRESRSNSQNNSAMLDSDISGVEPLQLSNSEKDQSLVQNKSENSLNNSSQKNSKPSISQESERPMFSTSKNTLDELSPNEARHSTPKYHDTPKFSDPPVIHSKKMNGNVDSNGTVPESEASITEVSALDETDGDMKSPKVPPSPKRSRLPMLSGETSTNAHRARSKERPPPVAPKPLHRPSQIQRLKSLERNQSETENSSHDQSSLQDDSSSILIHDGLDSSNNNSTYLNDSHNQNASSQIKKPNMPLSQKSPQKQVTNNSRIPKTASGAIKRPSSAMTGKQTENSNKDYNRQISNTSQNSTGFPEAASPGKPPTPKPKRPDNPPIKSDTPTHRKTSASPSRIPLGKSPTRQRSDSGAKTKLPQNNSSKSSQVDSKMTSKIPTIPSTDGQKGAATKSSKIPSSDKSSPSKRGRSAIPKPPRPNQPFITPDQVGAGGDNSQHRVLIKKAMSGYEALKEGELSFSEGSLITEISQDADNPGWCVGRLPDGTTGRFHSSFVEDVPPEELAAV